MPWDTGIGFSLTDDSEPLVWQNSSHSKNVENSVLEWKGFTDFNDHAQSSNKSQSHPANTTSNTEMSVDSIFEAGTGTTSPLDDQSKSGGGRNFTERPEAGTVYLTGYSYDNLPLYIPFKPIPTVNEIHRQNKELTVKNMNGQLLDISIYQLLEEIEKEKKEKKDIQEAKEVIQQYNSGENQEAYMEIWEDDKNKKKGKGKENEDKKEEYEKDLWVNAYTPKRYTDLLGDERVNREVLSWVKEWDYCVFQKKDYINAQSSLNAMRNIDSNNNDKYKRPFKKIMLLAGPPGLGKTTLAHVVAKHCGYNVVEINASDDRTGNSVKNKLLSALEMQNITNGKPNLVIIDEIDGVSGKGSGDQNFIKLLVNIVTAESSQTTEKRRKRGKQLKPLMRPIICICNDQYTPVLKPLRTIAQIYSFKPPQPKQLAKRLKEICDNCNLKTDIRSLLALCEMTECDIRNCINTLQFINSKHEELTLETLSRVSIGHKDLNKSLFNIWENVFTVPNARDKRSYTLGQNLREEQQNIISNRYISRLTALINSSGEYEKIIIGCFENYIKLKTVNFSSDPSKSKYVLVSEWLEFYDYINLHIAKFAQFELSEYAIYPIISFYRYFSSPSLRPAFPLAPYQQTSNQQNAIGRFRKPQPILEYPRHDYEAYMAMSNNLNILNQFISGINSQLQYNGWNYEEVVSGLSKEDLEKVKENDRKRISELKKATTEGVLNKISKPLDDEDKKIANAIDMKEFFKAKPSENSVKRTKSTDESSTRNAEIWFRYNEGYSNAVRTTVHMKDL
ncbi:hypothetical protein PIROE2DRAFT_59973 [Piromyces sp. E2]|nr:hypothetical protein PIROE2DRAFT_59973 [Piromyces sp. E2]|eukprot:OUM65465.1 hypothetical protein PIROE2DRAFT_59973 [Piromyces sp. E2]